MSFSLETEQVSVTEYLLKEDGDFLLLETGDKIITAEGGGNYSLEAEPT